MRNYRFQFFCEARFQSARLLAVLPEYQKPTLLAYPPFRGNLRSDGTTQHPFYIIFAF
jgi:hypothetical protein